MVDALRRNFVTLAALFDGSWISPEILEPCQAALKVRHTDFLAFLNVLDASKGS